MSTRSLSSRSLFPRSFSGRSLRAAISPVALWRQVALMRAAARQRRALARLDVAALRDIGITPEQAAAEASRPLWDVTPSWRR
jgi:uncharacterized protein YjiS (DUF1127 family)